MARPCVLDEGKRREIVAILSVGCSRRIAAGYVGCAVSTIRNTAKRDRRFAEQLRHAEHNVEIAYLQNIRQAGKKEQYWRTAAWALERKNPQDHAPRGPDVVTAIQTEELLSELAELLVEELPAARHRKSIIKRVKAWIRRLRGPSDHEAASDEQ